MHLGLFSYLTLDHRAAQAYLNHKAAGGLRLKRIWLGLVAQFEETDCPPTYAVDLADPLRQEPEEYRTLCADAGWEEVCLVRYMRVYQSQPGAAPTPIQTDGAVEYQRYRANVLGRLLRSSGSLLLDVLLLGLYFGLSGRSLAELFLTSCVRMDVFGLFVLLLPLILGLVLIYLGILFSRLYTWHRCTDRGESIPTPRPAAARLRGLLVVLADVVLTLVVAALMVDLTRVPSNFFGFAFFGLLIGLPMAAVVHRDKPRGGGRWYKNPLLYLLTLALVLYLAFPAGFTTIYQLPPPPLPPALAGEEIFYRTHGALLGVEDSWSVERILSDGTPARVQVRRYTFRLPWMAQALARSLLREDLVPVEGLTDAWWTPEGRPGWSSGEVLLLRGGTVLTCLVYNPPISPQLPQTLVDWLP